MNVKATRKNSEHFYSKRLIKIKDLSTSNKFTRMLCLCLFTSRLPITEAVIQISSKTNVHLVVAIINSHFPRHRYVNRHNNVAKHTCNHPFPSSSWAYTSQQLASTANTHSSNYHHKAHNIRTNLRFSSLLTFYRVDHWLCVSHTFLRSSKWNYRLSQNESCGFEYQRFHSQSFFILNKSVNLIN